MKSISIDSFRERKVALVVDDDAMTIRMVSSILKDNNYHVIEGADGIDAIAKFILRQPSLIVIDLNMPFMDGCRAASIIRNMRRGNLCKIILFTSETNENVSVNYSCKSVDIIINKVNIIKLRDYIENNI